MRKYVFTVARLLLCGSLIILPFTLYAQDVSRDEFSLPGIGHFLNGKAFPSDSGFWIGGIGNSVDGHPEIIDIVHYSPTNGWSGTGLVDRGSANVPTGSLSRFAHNSSGIFVDSSGVYAVVESKESVLQDGLVRYTNGHWVAAGPLLHRGEISWIGRIGGKLAIGGTRLLPNDSAVEGSLLVFNGRSWSSPVPECLEGEVTNVVELANDDLVIFGRDLKACGPGTATVLFYSGDSVTAPFGGTRFEAIAGHKGEVLLLPQSSIAEPVLRFDGTSLDTLSNGFPLVGRFFNRAIMPGRGDTLFLCVDSGGWYSRIYRYDGYAWSQMPGKFDERVMDIVQTPDGQLFATGNFMGIDGTLVQRVARFTGETWEPLRRPGQVYRGILGAPRAILRTNDTLWIGGADLQINERVAKYSIIRMVGDRWEAPAEQPDGDVNRLEMFRGELVVAGCFEKIGKQPFANIATIRGDIWKPLGSGTEICIETVSVSDDRLIVGGSFDREGAVSQWDGTSWDGTVSVPSSYVSALLDLGDSVIVGVKPRNRGTRTLFILRDGVMQPMANSLMGTTSRIGPPYPTALHLHNDQIWAAGLFDSIDGRVTGGFAWYDGAWHGVRERGGTSVRKLYSTSGNLVIPGAGAGSAELGYRPISGVALLPDGGDYFESTDTSGRYGTVDIDLQGDRYTGITSSLNTLGGYFSYGITSGSIPSAPTAAPQLRRLPDTIDFGEVAVRHEIFRDLHLGTESGTSRAAWISMEIIEDDKTGFARTQQGSIGVSPGHTRVHPLSLHATEETEYRGLLRISNLTPGSEQTHDIVLRGRGVGKRAAITTSSDTLDFGMIPPGDHADLWLIVENEPGANDTLNLRIDQLQGSPFEVISGTGDVTLAFREFQLVTVRFRPVDNAPVIDTLHLFHNSRDREHPAPIILCGNGVKATTGVETERESRPSTLQIRSGPDRSTGSSISVRINRDSEELRLDLFSMDGRLVKSLWEGFLPAGGVEIPVETSDLPSGGYLLVLRRDRVLESHPLHVVR